MSEVVERIEASTARLASQQRRIASSLTALAEIGHRFDGAALRDAEEALIPLESAVRNLTAEVGKLPGHVEAVLEREIETVRSEADDAMSNLSSRWERLERSQAQLVEVLQALPEQVTTELRAFPELLEAHQARLASANAELVGAIESANASLEGAIADQIETSGENLSKVLDQLQQFARNDLGKRAEGIAGKGGELVQRLFGDVSQLAGRGGDELRGAAEAAIGALEDEIRRGVDQKLPDAQRELVEHAVRALGEEIIEGIAMSTAGAQISAALSPYLVYMIAVKEALELLLQAIRIFKNPIKEIL